MSLGNKNSDEKVWIAIVANENFAEMAIFLLCSISLTRDVNLVKGVVIGDLGISEKSRRILSSIFQNTIFVDFNQKLDHDVSHHSHNWVKAVYQKTRLLKRCIEDKRLPVILMDADQFCRTNFISSCNGGRAAALTRRHMKAISKGTDDRENRYIGSFVRYNDENAQKFNDLWIAEIDRRVAAGEGPPYETPALNAVIKKQPDLLMIQDLSMKEYSCPPSKFSWLFTKIVHYKGPKDFNQISFIDFVSKLPGMKAGILSKFKQVSDK